MSYVDQNSNLNHSKSTQPFSRITAIGDGNLILLLKMRTLLFDLFIGHLQKYA